MTEKSIRDIVLVKGAPFTTQFIIRFDKEWGEAIRAIRKSGKDLKHIPITSR